MAVIHQRPPLTAVHHSISGLPQKQASRHASPEPQILTAVAQMLLINNLAASDHTGTRPWLRRPPCC